ncbi:MAG: PQQ-binding-like beta-propeller repeat protein [Phycisphaerae bacterium]
MSIAGLIAPDRAHAQWTQWGGPQRDFTAKDARLSSEWPESGPKRLWERDLGHGYSTILVDEGVLYTLYRDGNQDVVAAMDAASGETKWEHRYDAPPYAGLDKSFGYGARATPLIVDDRIYSVGAIGHLFCLDKKSGAVIWSHDLIGEYGGTKVRWGYSSSPIAYADTIILPVGGSRHGIMAFDQETGKVKWSKHDFDNAYASPLIIQVEGQEHLIAFVSDQVVGLDPRNGAKHWSHKHETSYDVNAASPVWCDDNILIVSSGYDTGTRALQLSKKGRRVRAKELWFNRDLRVHHGNVIRIGDYIYGSHGKRGPAFLTAIHVKDGKTVWQERGFAKTTALLADGKLIVLDEDGKLGLISVSPDGMTIHQSVNLLERVAWTAPTLVGGTLYVRDLKKIMALDVG